ncbi:UbiA family prenyltransferase [Pedobacter sp. PAMC26386]|nr:UbiA family prenyltransferase [Pedobacter sp. PAMC26386]
MNIKSIGAYFKERFPPVNMLLFAILFFTAYSVASYFSVQHINPGYKNWVGVIAVISFFFRLRVFDEVKDLQLDNINHPGRVLQSGRISLKQLFLLSAVVSIAEPIWSYWCGPTTLICWVVALSYSILMRYEFFISSFLKPRLFLYACTHMLIMPLIMLWVWSAYNHDLFHPSLYLLGALSLFGGFCFEIARKIHSPDAERPMVDSYSKSIGYYTSIACVLLFLLAGIAVQCYLLYSIQSRLWAYLIIGLLYLFTCIIYAIVAKQPQEKKIRVAELFVSLFMLISYVSVIIEIQLKS